MNDIKKEVIIKKSTNRLKNRDYKLIRKYIAKLSITRRQRSFSFSMFILRVRSTKRVCFHSRRPSTQHSFRRRVFSSRHSLGRRVAKHTWLLRSYNFSRIYTRFTFNLHNSFLNVETPNFPFVGEEGTNSRIEISVLEVVLLDEEGRNWSMFLQQTATIVQSI